MPLLTRAQEDGRHPDAAEIAISLTACWIAVGGLTRAVHIAEAELRAVELADLTGTDQHLRLGATLVWALLERGDILAAQLRGEELIAQAGTVGRPRGRGAVSWNAATVAEARGQLELAHRCSSRAVALLSEHSDDRDIARLRLAVAHFRMSGPEPDPHDVLDQLARAETSLRFSGSAVDRATVDVERSRAHLLLGDVTTAEACARSVPIPRPSRSSAGHC